MTGTLKKRAIRGTVVSLGGEGAKHSLRLISNLVLTRLLTPEDYGLMTLVITVLSGLQMISDVGIIPNIIQHERGEEPDFLDTAWTISVLRGVILMVAGVVLAYPLTELIWIDKPALRELLIVAVVTAIFDGLVSTKIATLNRQIALERIMVVELGAQITALCVGVVHAYYTRSVWALVFMSLTLSFMKMALSHLILPGRNNRFRWEPEAARAVFSFGKWIFVSTVVTYFGLRLDNFLLGRWIPTATLGVFGLSRLVAELPSSISQRVVHMVLLPAFSESHRGHPNALRESFAGARKALLPLGLLLVLGAAILAPPFFHGLYDEAWHDAAWMCQLAMVGIWFYFLHEASGRALIALGDSRALAVTDFAKLGVAAVAFWIGFEFYGLPGFIIGGGIGSMAGQLATVYFLHKRGLPSLAGDAFYTVLGLGLGLIGCYGPIWAAERSTWDFKYEISVFGIARFRLSEYIIFCVIAAVLVLGPFAAWCAKVSLALIKERRTEKSARPRNNPPKQKRRKKRRR